MIFRILEIAVPKAANSFPHASLRYITKGMCAKVCFASSFGRRQAMRELMDFFWPIAYAASLADGMILYHGYP